MINWWMELGSAGQVFACIAIPATVMLLIQTILTLIGLGGDHGDSHDGAGADIEAGGHEFDVGHGHDLEIGQGHDFDVGHDVADVTADAFDGDAGGAMVDTAEIHDGHSGHDGFDGGLRLFTMRGLIAFFAVMGWVGVVCCTGGVDIGVSVLTAIVSGFAAMVLVALLMKLLYSLQDDGTEDIRDALGVSGTVYLKIPRARTGRGKVNAIIRGKLSEKGAVTDEDTDIAYGEEVVVIGISGEDTLIVRRKNRI